MEKLIDLHTHSVHSDGTMTATELVNHAKNSGLAAISLTDHDGIDGVKEAMSEGERIGIEVVPGIEFSVQSATETHILGYYIDIDHESITKTIPEIRRVRRERNMETAENLQKMGFDITFEEAEAISTGGMVARAHFAKLMVKKGYAASVKEAFDKYLSSGKGGYSSHQYLTAKDAVRIIKDAGGYSFVAHLHLIKLSDDDLYNFLKALKAEGLDGIEGYYTEYTDGMQQKYMKMAKELNLAISGGTDFHAAAKPHISIGRGLGNMKIPYSVLEGIKALRNGDFI